MRPAAVSQIDVAETGKDAIKLATSSHYDLVLLDIGLPDMSGLEVAKAIRQFERDQNRAPLPIVGLTAHLSCVHQALIAGIQQVLYKPLTVEKAEVILKNWIQALQLQNHKVRVEATKTSELPIDLALAEKLTGNKTLAKNMFEDFIQALPQDLQKIKNAFHSKNKDLLKEAVHYLNGGSSYAGVPLLKKACNSLEVALSDNFSDAEIAELFSDICIEAEKVLKFSQQVQ